ncbi:hypothetical protein NDQ41_10060 [Alcaligenes faecalis]|uniref:hypothetical protein n=1 Tax=Alcaligenes TaxID=507 RepID=UPI00117896B8|nr:MULTISPECIES: hypothetical protein [Alcaligenes]MBH0310136.1 hypothetical protein [Alcaligenes faecalis]MCM2559046.1 hypothetical protein [Alcaligenes faecalis]MCM2623278.1 hypothetical protein [Alcaligenes faecalis]MCX5473059.1 hypothetical protein [Alcaligenes nematophilus]
MNAIIQPLTTSMWWVPPIGLLITAGLITAGVFHAYRAVRLWQLRNTPISDPVIAKALEGVKPPPYALYAAMYFAGGIIMAIATFILRQTTL